MSEPVAKPLQIASSVIPAKTGIQRIQRLLDTGFHRGDEEMCFCK
jgi:hypothetical protein